MGVAGMMGMTVLVSDMEKPRAAGNDATQTPAVLGAGCKPKRSMLLCFVCFQYIF
jgi:hypothetical protein